MQVRSSAANQHELRIRSCREGAARTMLTAMQSLLSFVFHRTQLGITKSPRQNAVLRSAAQPASFGALVLGEARPCKGGPTHSTRPILSLVHLPVRCRGVSSVVVAITSANFVIIVVPSSSARVTCLTQRALMSSIWDTAVLLQRS